MKEVTYKKDNKIQKSLIRDSDSENLAEQGIPLNPPIFDDILDEAKTNLYNDLVERGVFDVDSLNRRNGVLSSLVNKHITRKIVERYLLEENADNNKE